jgi:hypothetical protein
MLPVAALTLAFAWWAGIPTVALWKETSVLFGMFALYATAFRRKIETNEVYNQQEMSGGAAGEHNSVL